MLVKLAEIDELGLRELIVEAWLTQAPKRLVQEFLGEVDLKRRPADGVASEVSDVTLITPATLATLDNSITTT